MIPQPEPQAAVAHVLVVEDDVLLRTVVVEALRTTGLAVVEANCADAALTYIRAGGKVDLIFSDIQMPGELDGRDLAATIARSHPEIPVILTSGAPHLGAAMPAGFVVAKPYGIAHIVSLIFSTLGLSLPEEPS